LLKKTALKYPSKRYKIWLKQASFDLQACKLSTDNGFYEWACFQAEQAVEKALKGVLVKAGWRPPKVHKLPILMGYCNSANNEFKNTKFNFRNLGAFTFVSRYPFLIPGENLSPHEFITLDNAQKCLQEASVMLSQIKFLLKE